ncbi:MAG: MFS transporter [Ketobacter sp.]|uniref:MFS transporter n=1 Tax=Ketobacter sp. MCCC 1A13808 TaxID=2602738 RepID=UPI0018DC16AD|nr:MFS transporter [Ketobacter sp. MCCC 1A13808]
MSGFKVFYFILIGQSLSLLGSTLTNFGLGVWAYQTGESVTNFTMIAIASTLPGILLGPVIGSVVDRVDRKLILFAAQLGTALVTLILALLYWNGMLEIWHIILIVPFASVFGTILQIGFTSTVTLLVPKEGLSRANGSLGLAFGVVQLAGPLLAGIAMDQIGMDGIFIIDIASFVVGLATLIIASIPNPEQAKDKQKTSLLRDIVEAYQFLKSKPGVLGGLYLFTLIWFNVSAVQVLILPLILSFSGTTDLGFIQSIAGLGMLVGGILMIAWKGPKKRMHGILFSSVFIAVMLVLLPIPPNVYWIAGCAFLIMTAAPIATVCSQTLWQRKVPVAFHGRAFSLRNSIMKAAQPLAFLSAGLLADHLFEPIMLEGQWGALLFGSVWGVGEGRGVALMISLFGALSLVMALIAWSIKSIRTADTALPDENPDRIDVQPEQDAVL